jgi:hypothetical protein
LIPPLSCYLSRSTAASEEINCHSLLRLMVTDWSTEVLDSK